MSRGVFAIILTIMLVVPVYAQYDFIYIEGEDFDRGEATGIREKGFTSWMGHPSHEKVVIFGHPADGFVEYDIQGLGDGPYTLFIRCLARPETKTRVLWNGEFIGMIEHDRPATALAWSRPIGPVEGAGEHVLRLEGSEDTAQWPYIDVILLTNQAEYRPVAAEADFVTARSAFPFLAVPPAEGDSVLTIAPSPPSAPPSLQGVRINAARVTQPVIGEVELTLEIAAEQAVSLELEAGFAGDTAQGPRRSAAVALEPGVNTAAVTVPVLYAGKGQLEVVVRGANEQSADAAYTLHVPPPVVLTLDEYAYPQGTAVATLSARLHCTPDIAQELALRAALYRDGETQALETWVVRPEEGAETVTVPISLENISIGRYELRMDVSISDVRALAENREFIVFQPARWPDWEPVHETRMEGGRILLNGRPFMGRLLFHATANDTIREYGYNLVQCWGSDPDPLPSIQRHLDLCEEAGIYGAVALFNNRFFLEDGAFNLENIERAVLAFKDHPALWGWDLIDEPEIQRPPVSPEAVLEATELVRRLDENRHVIWINLCQTRVALDYLESQDLWSFDVYPFPSQSLFSYRPWLDISDEHLLGRVPLGTCLQTYSGFGPEGMPTPDQLRASALLHIMHDYTWFGYYSYFDPEPAGCLVRHPLLWSYTRALNAELQHLEEAILAPGEWRPVHMEPARPQLQAREKRVGEKTYLIVVNDADEPVEVTLQPAVPRFAATLLFEAEDVTIVGTEIHTTIRPSGSEVYELVAQP